MKNTKILIIMVLAVFISFGKTEKLIAKLNDTISIAVMGEPRSLDPLNSEGTWEANIAIDLFTGLLQYDPKGNPVPGIAKTWSVSPNGKVYTFNLIDSKWSDGTALTAHDFEYAIKKMLSPEQVAVYSSLLYVIKGGEEYNTGKGTADQVMVKAVNNKTLTIELVSPAPYFLSMLVNPWFSPIPKHVVEVKGKQWSKPENMVSNGAYMLVSWKPGSYIKAKKNPYFYDADKVSIENVIYYTQEDRSALLKRFRSKEIDIIDDFASDQYEWLLRNIKDEVKVGPYSAIYYYSVNVATTSPLQNQKVREALALSIDREFITDKVLKSGEIPAYSFIPEGLSGDYKPAQFTWKNLNKEQRIAKAKKLLEEAGFTKENPLQIEIAYNSSEDDKKIAIAVTSMWKDIGINSSSLNREVAIHYKELQQQNYQVGRARWVADYPDPSNFLYVLKDGVAYNYGKYNSKAYNNAVNKSSIEQNLSKRNTDYRNAEQIALNDVAVIPIFYFVTKSLVSTRVQGWEQNTVNFHLTRYMSIK